MTRTLIRVTQEDIDKGCKFRAYNCPIARAVNRIVTPREAAVGPSHISFYGVAPSRQNCVGRSSLPIRARRFLRHFDRGRAVKPLNFYLEIPS